MIEEKGENKMWCGKCDHDLVECDCPDLKERMDKIIRSKFILSRVCATCKNHYAVCECETPVWTTSDKIDFEGEEKIT